MNSFSSQEARPGAAEARRGPAAPWGRSPWPVLTAGGALLVYLGLFLATVFDSFIRAPFGDAFDFLTVELQAEARGDRGLYLWAPHNGHHLVWVRLLTAIDVRLFHGRSVVFLAAALIALLAATALIAREIRRGVAEPRTGFVLACTAPLALLTTLNAVDVSIPINTVYVFSMAFAIAALVLYEAGPARPAVGLSVLALVAGAAMGNSIGLAAVPVLMIAAWRRPDRAHRPLLWIAGPLLVAVFVLGAGSMSVEAALPPQTPAQHALRLVQYFVGFCGLPWSASSQKLALPGGLAALSHLAAAVLGVGAVVLGLMLAATPSKEATARGRLDRLCCDLILLSLGSAGMAALGRANASALLMVPVRYALIMAPLHVGLMVLLALRSPRAAEARGGWLAAAIAAVAVLAVAHQFVGRWVVLRYTTQVEQTIAAFHAGLRSPAMSDYVYPELRHAEEVSAELKRRGLYR